VIPLRSVVSSVPTTSTWRLLIGCLVAGWSLGSSRPSRRDREVPSGGVARPRGDLPVDSRKLSGRCEDVEGTSSLPREASCPGGSAGILADCFRSGARRSLTVQTTFRQSPVARSLDEFRLEDLGVPMGPGRRVRLPTRRAALEVFSQFLTVCEDRWGKLLAVWGYLILTAEVHEGCVQDFPVAPLAVR
jgi:hypothetical protein